MKNIFTKLMTSAVLLIAVGGCLEAQTSRMKVNVPFGWEADGHHLNAGEYEVSRDAVTNVIRLQGKASKSSAFFLAVPASDNNSVTRLVFHRYGNRYFLAEVVAPSLGAAKLSVSRDEKDVMRSASSGEMATVFVDVKPVAE